MPTHDSGRARARGRTRMRAFALAGAALALALGCTLLNPLGEYESGKRTVDAGPIASDASDDGFDGRACRLSRPPPRPSVPDVPPGDVVLVEALESFDFGETDAGAVPAYDLDGVCTCPEPESCKRPVGAKLACDGEGGADNAGGDTMVGIARVSTVPTNIDTNIRGGTFTMLMRVKDYNGQPDDPQVVFELFFSYGTQDFQDSGVNPVPKFDGNDTWTVDPSGVVGNNPSKYVSRYFDSHAYVAGGVLVAQFETAPVRLGPLVVNFLGGQFTAHLVSTGTSFRMEQGVMQGRVRAADLLTSFDVLFDRTSDSGVCGDRSSIYALLRPVVCNGVDLAFDPQRDNGGVQCDALGVTARFSASPARLGDPLGAPPRVRLCGDSWEASCP